MNVFIYLRYSSELLSYFEFITALFSLKIIIIGISMEYMDFDSSLVWLNFYRWNILQVMATFLLL